MKLRIALSIAAGVTTAALGYPVYTIEGFLMLLAACIAIHFVCTPMEDSK